MIDPNSRYANVETSSLKQTEDGEPRTIRYLKRRFVPSTNGMITLLKHPVRQQDRVDNIAAMYLNDPTQYYRICDANNALNPDELVETVGRTLTIVLPLR
jgi:hypothetical protein